VFTYPMFMLLNAGSLAGAIAAHAGLAALEAVFVCASLAAGAELFATRVRSSGYSIGYHTSVAILAAPRPTSRPGWSTARTTTSRLPLYVVAAVVVTVVAVLTMRETARQPLRQTDSVMSAPMAKV
jgi:MFS transporter, MHS family, proline/betaine transporter